MLLRMLTNSLMERKRGEHEQPIIRALDAAFDVPAGAGSLENHIMEAAERLARDYWEENRRQISDCLLYTSSCV